MSNKVKKTANKFYKQLKGRITFETVESYLMKIGYKIILFNTPTGDIEVARYRLAEKVQTTNAFTYCGTAKIIFLALRMRHKNLKCVLPILNNC